MRLLEEFWCGNIEPTEYGTSSKQRVQEISGADLPERRKAQSHHDGRTGRIV